LAVAARPLLVTLRALGLGDLLTAVPALRALARAFPDHRRVLAAPAALAPLVELIRVGGERPVIDEVVDTAALAPLPAELHGADVAVNLHGRGPQSHALLAAAAPRRLVAFASRDAGVDGPRWIPGEHEVARWCRMLEQSGIPAEPRELGIDAPDPGVLEPRVRHAAMGATIVHPGAASAARRWPPSRFAAVARAEASAGRPVVITGGTEDVRLARGVARLAGLPDEAVTAGRTDLRRLAAIVALAARVVCGDTGVAHLATALGTPSVVLFGPTSPAEWGPPPRDLHRVVWAGRRGDPHAPTPDRGLLELGEERVLAELDALQTLE
jgi:ADP-heptose:LPS heptosyltransferase